MIDEERDRADFVQRLTELAAEFASRAEFARRAELSAGALQHYINGDTEPTRPALVALAQAAGVDPGWLASGMGSRNRSDVPAGYVNLAVFDLGATGNHIRGILPHLDHPPTGRLFKQSDLVEKARASLKSYAVENHPLEFEPIIKAGDVFLFTIPHKHQVARPSAVETWDFISKDGDHEVYLVADDATLKIRRLNRRRHDSVEVQLPNGKVEQTLAGTPRDFILFGLVIWRGGVIAPLNP
jgi:transcriptional regulator with XRE-family HTH domain